MLNLIEKLIVKRRGLVFEEADLTRVLRVINEHQDPWFICRPNMTVGDCCWKDDNKWFAHFSASEDAWQKIVSDLKVVRVWRNCDIPKNSKGKVYSTD